MFHCKYVIVLNKKKKKEKKEEIFISKIQWNLFITRSLGPWKLPCYIRFLVISG